MLFQWLVTAQADLTSVKRSGRLRFAGLFLLAGVMGGGVLGCGSGDGLNRKAIQGTVTVNGVAVPNGSVTFEPLYAGGVGSGAVITQGAYQIAQKDGLPPGKYRVQITGDDGQNFTVTEGKMPGDEIMPPKKQLVPSGWKQDIEVADEGPFDFNFDIKSKR